MMTDLVTGIVSAIMAVLAVVVAIVAFYVAPRFLRKQLTYELELATPLIHPSAQPNSDLTIKYGKRYAKRSLKDPHIVRVRLTNNGRQEVRSSDFDLNTPLQIDVGVKIVALLRVSCSLDDMPDPRVSISEHRIDVSPGLIPRRASIYFVILLDSPCGELTHKSSLSGVGVKQNKRAERRGMSLSSVIRYLAIAFVVWWVIQEPASAARLVHGVGAFLSSAAHGLSNFVASI
jgi:hypothetical protein